MEITTYKYTSKDITNLPWYGFGQIITTGENDGYNRCTITLTSDDIVVQGCTTNKYSAWTNFFNGLYLVMAGASIVSSLFTDEETA